MSLKTQQLGLQTAVFIVCTNHCGLQVQHAQHRPRVYLQKSATDPLDSLTSLCALGLAANQVMIEQRPLAIHSTPWAKAVLQGQ